MRLSEHQAILADVHAAHNAELARMHGLLEREREERQELLNRLQFPDRPVGPRHAVVDQLPQDPYHEDHEELAKVGAIFHEDGFTVEPPPS